MSAADTVVAEALAAGAVVIFSKTWCPFCKQVKSLFGTLPLKDEPHFVELDLRDDEDAVQDALLGITGARSVPRVNVGGTWVGGCDDTVAAHQRGELEKLLRGAGAWAGADASISAVNNINVLQTTARHLVPNDTAASSTLPLLSLPNLGDVPLLDLPEAVPSWKMIQDVNANRDKAQVGPTRGYTAVRSLTLSGAGGAMLLCRREPF